MCANILVAEDDRKQAELLRSYLELDGHDVLVAHDGRSTIAHARRQPPDLLLDVMLPDVDGLEVCRILRADTTAAVAEVAVLMLTARSTEEDLLLGLDRGADDYLTKPYSPRELMARVRSLLRRALRESDAGRQVLVVGDLTIDSRRHEVTVGGQLAACTPVEFTLLSTLAAHPGQVFTRGQLVEHAYGVDGFVTERTIDVHAKNLRRKIETDPRAPARRG
ncbi:response regulator transcription factor [Saccharopolyspora shandongensis]|uniref:response regulator transcription factor n=1 Tax=Saccharopolyspora shandongensis TaxID=418495 RepID=UPI0034436E8F